MAHIVKFHSSVARTEPEREAEPQGGARIIIFPGVRRERRIDEPHRLQEGQPDRDWLRLDLAD